MSTWTAAKHALGRWIQDTEAAEFWQKVVTDLRNRGVRDILIAHCDGLTGLPDAIRVIFPDTVVQTYVVHVIRNAMRFVSYGDHRQGHAEIYTAPLSRPPSSPWPTSTTIRTTIFRRRGCLATRLGQLYSIP